MPSTISIMKNNTSLPSPRRFPAEWEHDCAILIAWPHEETDWAPMLSDVTRCYVDMVSAFTLHHDVIILAPSTDSARTALSSLDTPHNIYYVNVPTNDTWTRDYGPLTIQSPADGSMTLLDFCFNGWGMKFAACFDNLVSSHLKSISLLSAPMVCCRNFVLEGGGIESDGKGTLMTTAHCQLSPNRNPLLSPSDVSRKLCDYFGSQQTLMLTHGYLAGDDTDSHIDTLARFAPDDTILYVGCTNPADEHYEELSLMASELRQFRTLEGSPFNLFELPLPDPIFDEDGERLPATYANFLATPQAVFMPTYGQPLNDQLAQQIIAAAFQRPVITIDCRPLIRQHGSLHCATMQLPLPTLSFS